MKGLLALEKQDYPTGQKGHIIPHVGRCFSDHFKVELPADLLKAIDCKPDFRYGDVEATREDAFAAHVALLELLPFLARTLLSRAPLNT